MIGIIALLLIAGVAAAQDVLPFPNPPMGGKVGPTMQESVHKWREQPRRLPKDAPNILIVMFDDAGFGHPDTFGGEICTPTLSRLAKEDGPSPKAPREPPFRAGGCRQP